VTIARSIARYALVTLGGLAIPCALAGCIGEVAEHVDVQASGDDGSLVAGSVLVESGGAGFVDSQGRTWLADQGFVGGQTTDRGAITIAGTSDPAIYRTERWGLTGYRLAVANGDYRVRLHFAETYPAITAAGQRVFDVSVEGATVTGLDVFARAGGARRAWVETLDVRVTDGALDVSLAPRVQQPMISGIEILPRGAVRVNVGGGAFTDSAGRRWEADRGFVGGATVDRGAIAIAGADDPTLYRTERYGATGYRIPVPNGDYEVCAHFAETYDPIDTAAERVFDVAVEGGAPRTIDIVAAAGAPRTALVEAFVVAVTDGVLDLSLTARTQSTKLDGLEILPRVGTDGTSSCALASGGALTGEREGGQWVGPYERHVTLGTASIDVYTNIETAGVHVRGSGGRTYAVRYRAAGQSAWTSAHPFATVQDGTTGHLATSLFGLAEDECYEVEVSTGTTSTTIDACTQPDRFAIASERTLHVDRAAAAGGDGTATRPFQRIQAAIDVATAGTRISIAPGTYREHLVVTRSGEPNRWIRITSRDGLGTVVIDGADATFRLDTLPWRSWTGYTTLGCSTPIVASTLYQVSLSGQAILAQTSFQNIVRDGSTFQNYDPNNASIEVSEREDGLRFTALGMRCIPSQGCVRAPEGYFYDESTQTMYMRSLTHPSTHRYTVSTGDWAMQIRDARWIWVEGLEFRHNRGNGRGALIVRGASHNAVVRGNRFVHSGEAISVVSEGTGTTARRPSHARIEGNEITFPGAGNLRYEHIKNNEMRGQAINLTAGAQNIVRDNWVHDAYRGIGDSTVFSEGQNLEVDIYRNRLETLSSSRFMLERRWENVRVFGNVSRVGHVGVAMLDMRVGPYWMVRNVIHGFDGETMKARDDASPQTMLWYHNVIAQTELRRDHLCSTPTRPAARVCSDSNFDWTPSPATDADCRTLNYLWGSPADVVASGGFRFRNNVFYSTNFHAMVAETGSLSAAVADHDVLWRAGASSLYTEIATVGGSRYASLAALSAATGAERNGRQVDPRFVDIVGGRYKLGLGSPLIDTALLIPGINHTYCGRGPDIGAVESDCSY
jgi:hypothetical protein